MKSKAKTASVLREPALNKDTAFSEEERKSLKLEGLLPTCVDSLERQLERVRGQLDAKPNDLERYVYLQALCERNKTLFFATLMSDPARFVPIVLPGADAMRGVPIIGPLYANVISGNNILTYIAFLAVPICWWILYRTRFGLRLRAVGENPGAVDTAGISVAWLRYRSLIVAGILCGFSGTYLAIAQSASFIANMSAGKGYIALAALIFAKWRPVPVMLSCLLFGFLDAFANFMQGKAVPGIGEVPVQIFQALPYILTCILLAGFIGVAKPPKAGGVPYTKER